MTATRFTLEVRPIIPPQLQPLQVLASNLMYSWNQNIYGLFPELDPELWGECGHNPKVFLRQVAQHKLDEATANPEFMRRYQDALDWFEAYFRRPRHPEIEAAFTDQDLIAYFCSEFGFHESLPIYSGGLGILAADHCKAASDLGAPFVAIGLLYHKGYFNQLIDAAGNQISNLTPYHFGSLPISPACDTQGERIRISLRITNQDLVLNLWQAEIGRIKLYLLDADTEENTEENRRITHQLYGGDKHTRIKQEIILGVGGVRALRALGLAPNVWHINEGHSAFQILERAAELVHAGQSLEAALERVRSNTVFTTHTPVAAGHDNFYEDMMLNYFGDYAHTLGIGFDQFMALGTNRGEEHNFDMTSLAIRGSGFRNGVSRIHRQVAASMEHHLWPQIPVDENPFTYITNGVELPSYLAQEWSDLFNSQFPDWRERQLEPDYWRCLDDIDSHTYWAIHQSIKQRLLAEICVRLRRQHRRNGSSMAVTNASLCNIANADRDVLVLGFARRFATYKRATLLFSDPERLARMLSDVQRPVVIIYAGKAHPQDQPGQQLLKRIHEYSQSKEFVGRVILVEGYDIALARSMVAGVDVWLNTPEYPLEACGTSGQKAGLNGVINLSVLDGWWGEGYNRKNGWAVEPHGQDYDPHYRDRQEGSDLLDILEKQVIPAFFDRTALGIPERWIQRSKESMKSIIPQFNAQRMLMDYVRKLYLPAKQLDGRLRAYPAALDHLVAWKARIHEHWPGLTARLVQPPPKQMQFADRFHLRLAISPNGLSSQDLAVECLMGKHPSTNAMADEFQLLEMLRLAPSEPADGEELVYELNYQPESSGLLQYKLRVYPTHELLPHPFEMGYMLWVMG